MSPFIYQGKIYIENSEIIHDIDIESHINHFFENEVEYCKCPIIKVDENECHTLRFSIPFDNYCKIEVFEKDIIKVMYLIEKIGNCKIKDFYINVFEVFHVEDPVQYKYTCKRRDDKLILLKQVYKRDMYIKMKNYLRKSSKENAQFHDTLFPK